MRRAQRGASRPMKIAVVNETSTADRNADILAALRDRGHTIINAGMTRGGTSPELTVIHTGFLAAVLLATGRVDYVVAGCGTGQGFQIAVAQYPGVYCGHLMTPLDAWLFTQINGGNVVSLALNQGYGWAGDVNLRLIFDQLFGVEWGAGYPSHRTSTQRESRELLTGISETTHHPMAEIVRALPRRVVEPALRFPGVWELLDVGHLTDAWLAAALSERHGDG